MSCLPPTSPAPQHPSTGCTPGQALLIPTAPFPTASCTAEFGEQSVAPPFTAADDAGERKRCVWAEACVPSHGARGPSYTENGSALLKTPAKSLECKQHVPSPSGETLVGAGRWNARNVIASCLISNK